MSVTFYHHNHIRAERSKSIAAFIHFNRHVDSKYSTCHLLFGKYEYVVFGVVERNCIHVFMHSCPPFLLSSDITLK